MEIGPETLAGWRKAGTPVAVLDVREPWETDICLIEGSIKISLANLPQNAAKLPQEGPLVVVCHRGGRSMQAVSWLRSQGFANAINMAGGVDAWARQIDPKMSTY
jgi:rhodanese-related sulfurtransferase